MPDVHQWNGTAADYVDIETAVRSAEQLVSRCRTRFLAAGSATNPPPSEQQVRAALLAGAILPDKINYYLQQWNIQKLTGAPGIRQLTPTQRLAQDRADVNAQRLMQGLPSLSAAQYRQMMIAPPGTAPLPPLPQPQQPPPQPAPRPVPFDGRVSAPVSAGDEEPPLQSFGGGRR
jgi:hypothetical protein